MEVYIVFFLYMYLGMISCVRRSQPSNNLIINSLNRIFKISGDIKKIGDIKRCLKEEHGYHDHEILSNNSILKDDELYSEEKHKKLYTVSKIRGGLNISVQTMQGKRIQLQVSQNETVLDLKNKLEKEQTIPVDQQRLIFDGKLLENGKTIADYGIKDNAVLQLVLRLRGG
uniref:Ubiquitin,putative n=1 Tax=Theileria annulata TaxID=5874 RepID=A0A3B0NC52_THEAN